MFFDQTNLVYCWSQTTKINLFDLEMAILIRSLQTELPLSVSAAMFVPAVSTRERRKLTAVFKAQRAVNRAHAYKKKIISSV